MCAALIACEKLVDGVQGYFIFNPGAAAIGHTVGICQAEMQVESVGAGRSIWLASQLFSAQTCMSFCQRYAGSPVA